MSKPPVIALWSDTPGWHCRKLKAAFTSLGVVTKTVNPKACELDLSQHSGLRIPGFIDTLPSAVFVRGIPAGSFEQVTFRLTVLHALEAQGVPVYNSARMIELTVDKAMTSLLLHRADVPTPMTWVMESEPRVRQRVMRETSLIQDGAVVMKPLFGAEGKGLIRLGAGDHLPDGDIYHGLNYLQRFVASKASHDYRVFVIGGKAMYAMSRHSPHWIHNVAQGAKCKAEPLTSPLKIIAEKAVKAIMGLDYAGVDVMQDADGKLTVIEVNGVPAWRGLQSVVQDDIALALAKDVVQRKLKLPLQMLQARGAHSC